MNKLVMTISKLLVATVEYSKKSINMAYEMTNIRSVLDHSMELEAVCLASQGSLFVIA